MLWNQDVWFAAGDPDADDDGILDASDNCPTVSNASQDDLDRDGMGDACDADADGDGLDNDFEIARALDPFDADSDDDGVEDGAEIASGRNPNINEGAVVQIIIYSILGGNDE